MFSIYFCITVINLYLIPHFFVYNLEFIVIDIIVPLINMIYKFRNIKRSIQIQLIIGDNNFQYSAKEINLTELQELNSYNDLPELVLCHSSDSEDSDDLPELIPNDHFTDLPELIQNDFNTFPELIQLSDFNKNIKQCFNSSLNNNNNNITSIIIDKNEKSNNDIDAFQLLIEKIE